MKFDEMLAKQAEANNALLPQKPLCYTDSVLNAAENQELVTRYPDGSWSFDDLVSVIAMSTHDSFPFMMVRAGFLFHQRAGGTQIYFEDGFLTPPHKHNFVELAYVLEGQFHKQIEGKDYVFNRGEFFLLNRDVSHGEYYYRNNSAVIWLRLSSAFFGSSMQYKNMVMSGESEEFLRRFVMDSSRKYFFVRFTPPRPHQPTNQNTRLQNADEAPSQISNLFEQIFDELTLPRPGGVDIVIGYVKRLLALIPENNYQVSVEWNNRERTENHLFEKIRFLLEDRYEDVSMGDLIAAFGHNTDYFNRLIRRHTGMTYSAFLQNIRMERAVLLLKTTEFTVAEIARKTGYENVNYFYKIFTGKYGIKPKEMRKAQGRS
jgi:AraC-like DNA-binding protein